MKIQKLFKMEMYMALRKKNETRKIKKIDLENLIDYIYFAGFSYGVNKILGLLKKKKDTKDLAINALKLFKDAEKKIIGG